MHNLFRPSVIDIVYGIRIPFKFPKKVKTPGKDQIGLLK
jgi:hypothetical protein